MRRATALKTRAEPVEEYQGQLWHDVDPASKILGQKLGAGWSRSSIYSKMKGWKYGHHYRHIGGRTKLSISRILKEYS